MRVFSSVDRVLWSARLPRSKLLVGVAQLGDLPLEIPHHLPALLDRSVGHAGLSRQDVVVAEQIHDAAMLGIQDFTRLAQAVKNLPGPVPTELGQFLDDGFDGLPDPAELTGFCLREVVIGLFHHLLFLVQTRLLFGNGYLRRLVLAGIFLHVFHGGPGEGLLPLLLFNRLLVVLWLLRDLVQGFLPLRQGNLGLLFRSGAPVRFSLAFARLLHLPLDLLLPSVFGRRRLRRHRSFFRGRGGRFSHW
jgi:hypothetical protein